MMQTTQDCYGKVVEKRISLEILRLEGDWLASLLSLKTKPYKVM